MKDRIVIHHSAISGDAPQFDDVWDYHNRKWEGHGIAYHYFIERDGSIHQGREERSIGYHSGKWLMNVRSIGVCFAGNFIADEPTEAQLEAGTALISDIQRRRGATVLEHRHVKGTFCPGFSFRDEIERRQEETLVKRLKVAQKALKRVSPRRKKRLTRFIERVQRLLGVVNS